MEEKEKYDNQIKTILSIIQQSDSIQLQKIALETLYNKFYENQYILYLIFGNLINFVEEGNLKIIEEVKVYVESMLDEFDNTTILKTLNYPLIRNQLEKEITNNNLEPFFFTINKNNIVENLKSIDYYDSSEIINRSKIANLEFLYSEKSDKEFIVDNENKSTEDEFNNTNLQLLFPENNQFKQEIERSMDKKILLKSKKTDELKKLKLSEYYNLNRKSYNLDEINNNPSPSVKKKKINDNKTSNINYIELYFIPFYSIIKHLIELNSDYNWKKRKCSNLFLRILYNFFDKIFYCHYKIKCTVITNIEEEITKIEIDNIFVNDKEINETMKSLSIEYLFSQLIINSLLDKVVDFNCEESICLLKEMNIKLSVDLLKYDNDKLKLKIFRVLVDLINDKKFIKESDWQSIYTVLLFFKYYQDSNIEENGIIFIENRNLLLNSMTSLLEYDSEEIINLTIQILEKILLDNLNLPFDGKIFSDFLDLIKKYDDIDKGVKFYFKCLVKFVHFFVSSSTNNNLHSNTNLNIHFNKLKQIVEENLIFFSFNKIISVRICYYEVMSKILTCLEINPKTIEENFIIAVQGLCLEEDKELLKIQQKFLFNLINCLANQESFINIINKNLKRIFKLISIENINNTKSLYFPNSNDFELESLYKSFFISDLERVQIKVNLERKLNYLIPILSLILSRNINFTDHYLGYLSLSVNELYISKNSVLMLKIYLNYLELIEAQPNKILIFSDEQLFNLSDQKYIESNLPISYNDGNDMGILYTKLLNILPNEIGKIKDNNLKTEINLQLEKLKEYQNILITKKLIYKKMIEDNLKVMVDSLPKHFSQDVNLLAFIQKLNDIDNLQTTVNLKNLMRSLSSCCLLVHKYFNNNKIDKISNIANSLINSLKLNNKDSKIFSKYLLILMKSSNVEVTNKILRIFFDNSISLFSEEMAYKIKENESTNTTKESSKSGNSLIFNVIKDTKYLPLKYFFKYNLLYRYLDIPKFFDNYLELEGNQKDNYIVNLNKYFLILYLISKMKFSDMKYFVFKNFFKYLKDFLPHYSSYFSNELFIELIGNIINNYSNCFSDLNSEDDISYILQNIFSEMEIDQLFFIKLIDNLLNYEKFQIQSVQFTSSILSKISHRNIEIREISNLLFSKMMRIISLLKLDRKYEEIVKFENSDDGYKGDLSNNNKSFDFLKSLFSQKILTEVDLKFKLKFVLRSYQLTGIKWLSFLGSNSLGAALCDDMGLGKTIQTLVCIINESIKHYEKSKKYPFNIIICPNTLVLNWKNESKKFIDEKTAKIVDLSIYNFDSIYKKLINKKVSSKDKLKLEIYITSYDQIRDFNFSPFEFFYTVLDEAHIIKNAKSKIFQSISKIISERKIILTGTPIQNNVMELWTLFDFLMPGFLGNENDFEINYQKKIQTNIKKLNLEEKLQENIFQVSLSEIRKRIKPFILRRLKKDVLKELPEKIINDYICELTDCQRIVYDFYEKIFNAEKKKVTKKKGATVPVKDENNWQSFKIINRLRKICNYPGFILNYPEDLAKLKLSSNDLISIKDYNSSAKLNSLEDILLTLGFDQNNLNQENKVLIFSQGNKTLNLIEEFLNKKYSFLRVKKLSSELNSEKRMELVNEFNQKYSIDILLLTTAIGGLGLSLTAANIVIMFDHDWNPMKDLQAMDRAHRIGQTKSVQVFRYHILFILG